LAAKRVTIYTGKRLESVSDEAAVVVDRYGKRQELAVDSIVIASDLLHRCVSETVWSRKPTSMSTQWAIA
jgi:hypothetical protein